MAAYQNPGPGGRADLYSDTESEPGPAVEPAEAPEEETPEESSNTFTLPIEALSGQELKPGDQVSLEVVRVNEDSVEVRKPGDAEPEETEPEAPAAPPPAAGGEMSGMME